MKYIIDYQYMPKDIGRPLDDGEIIGIEANDENDFVLLPNVGDYVTINNSADRSSFHGKVRTRLFSYQRLSNDVVHCIVNIVVEETDDDWSQLIKS